MITNRGAPRQDAPVAGTDFSRSASLGKIGAQQLDELMNAYADRYRTLLEDAVSDLCNGNPDPRQRAVAQRFLVESATSMYDIATNGDPFSQLLDATIVVTLTSQVWIDEDRASRVFGARGDRLVEGLRQARTEIWDIAARVFLPDQLSALDFIIAGWRRKNRAVEDVSYVRLDDFAASRGLSVVEEARSGGGLFEPLDKAVAQAKSYELLIERMFFIGKRAPTLVTWQTQATIDEFLAKEETIQTLANLASVTQSIDGLAKTSDRLADEIPALVQSERAAIFAELDRRQADLDNTLAQVRELTAEARAIVDAAAPLAQSLTTTLEPTLAAVERLATTSERIVGKVAEITGPAPPHDPDAPPAKPFDIADYERTLAAATRALEEANSILRGGESLAESPAIKGLIDEITNETERRVDHAEEVASRLIWRAAIAAAGIVVLSFLLLFALRATGRRA